MGGATQANAGLYKNNAAIKKTEASNQWNYFQAKSTKQSLAEVSRDLSPPDKQAIYQAKIDRYEKEKKEIETEARKLEAQATEWDKQERRADAPAPPLGPGHHGAAGVDRPGGHRAADARRSGWSGACSASPPSAPASACWRCCTSERIDEDHHLERQFAHGAAAARAGLDGRQPRGRAVPAGTQAHRRQVPAGRAARGRLRALRRVRPEDVQRRGHHEPPSAARHREEHRRASPTSIRA